MKTHGTIELTQEEIDTIWDFFDVLGDLGAVASDKRTIDIVRYLLAKWAYQQKNKGDATIYIDQIDKED